MQAGAQHFCWSMQVALRQLLQDPRLYEPLTPLRLRQGNDAWPAAVEAMLETLLSAVVCCCCGTIEVQLPPQTLSRHLIKAPDQHLSAFSMMPLLFYSIGRDKAIFSLRWHTTCTKEARHSSRGMNGLRLGVASCPQTTLASGIASPRSCSALAPMVSHYKSSTASICSTSCFGLPAGLSCHATPRPLGLQGRRLQGCDRNISQGLPKAMVHWHVMLLLPA